MFVGVLRLGADVACAVPNASVGIKVPGAFVNGVPVPKVAVNVSKIGFLVSVAVTCKVGVEVIVGVSVNIRGVLLGNSVGVGMA